MSKLNGAQLETAKKIHRELFSNFVWTSDEDANGVAEFWDRIVPSSSGKYFDDCDSFAIEMHFRLVQAGIPADALRLAACSLSKKVIDHCVLILDTEQGLMVSECNTSKIVPLKSLPYTMWYAQQPGDIRKDWLKVE